MGPLVQFGWGQAGHVAINHEAFRALPESSFKRFVQNHDAEIRRVSLQQDRQLPGAKHFLNVESLKGAKKELKKVPSEVDLKSFQTVVSFFKPDAFDKRFKKMTQRLGMWLGVEETAFNPLKQLKPPGDVYQAVIKNYDDLVFLLKEERVEHDEAKQRLLSREVVRTIGRLSHYTADMTQPMHTSRFYDWRLEKKVKGHNAHQFFEVDVMDKADYKAWSEKFRALQARRPLPENKVLSESVRNERLIGVLQQGYRSLFELVQQDKRARNRSEILSRHGQGSGKVKLRDYRQQLKTRWQPIAEKRMDEASVLLATLLQSAYVESETVEVIDFKPKAVPQKRALAAPEAQSTLRLSVQV